MILREMAVNILLLVLMPALDAENRCHQSSLECQLPEPGPLNLSSGGNNSDYIFVGEKANIFFCIPHFTTFSWFRYLSNGSLWSYPWGQQNRLALCNGNQTVVIYKSEVVDRGDYVYIASNGTANVSGIFHLAIDCKPELGRLITSEQPQLSVAIGTNIILQCAAFFGFCETHDGFVEWLWVGRNGHSSVIATANNLVVICNSGNSSCNLTISTVSERDYAGIFVCQLVSPSIFGVKNYSVQLVPPGIQTKSLLGLIIGITISMLIMGALGMGLWWRHGECIKFWLRRQPERGNYDFDAIVVHGDDHCEFVQNKLKPRLEEFGYEIFAEDAKLGQPKALEHAEAIMNAFCVIFSYSQFEIEHGEPLFLAKVAQTTHSYRNVIIIRNDLLDDSKRSKDSVSQKNDAFVKVDSSDSKQKVLNRSDTQPANNRKKQKNVWKCDELKLVTVLSWPKISETNNPEDQYISREIDKFWYQLRSHLPKLLKVTSTNRRPKMDKTSRFSQSSASSQKRLLSQDDKTNIEISDQMDGDDLEKSDFALENYETDKENHHRVAEDLDKESNEKPQFSFDPSDSFARTVAADVHHPRPSSELSDSLISSVDTPPAIMSEVDRKLDEHQIWSQESGYHSISP